MTASGTRWPTSTVEVGETSVAYHQSGNGQPLLLLHGCPFSSFVWRNVVTTLNADRRCIAPDLLGLGDTESPSGSDWSLRAQAEMIVGFLDALDLPVVDIVGHDHGGAVSQILAAEHPDRIRRLVLMNAEAYDNWPSREERPFIRLTQLPLLGRATLWLYGRRPVARMVLAAGRAVEDRSALDQEFVDGFVAANLGDPHRRAKTKRFLRVQLDPDNQRCTSDALEGLRRFEQPTLLLWAQNDPHFGLQWAELLRADIPGARPIEILPGCGHLLMEEKPQEVAGVIGEFLSEEAPRSAPFRSAPPQAAFDEILDWL